MKTTMPIMYSKSVYGVIYIICPVFMSLDINDGVDKPYEVISMVLLEVIFNVLILFSN